MVIPGGNCRVPHLVFTVFFFNSPKTSHVANVFYNGNTDSVIILIMICNINIY